MTPNYEHFEQVVKQLHDIWLNDMADDMEAIIPKMDAIIAEAKIKHVDADKFYDTMNTSVSDNYKRFYNVCYEYLDFGQEREQDDDEPYEDDSGWREFREYFEERNN